jgi:corrinoid protein of di/trimethylamine methyltransferase
MSMSQKIIEEIRETVPTYEEERVLKLTRDALAQGLDPLQIFEQGLIKGLLIVEDKWTKEEAYLPELIVAADIVTKGLEILKPELKARNIKIQRLGKVVIGTVEGDIHDIGKNIVIIMLEIAGFEIHDLGKSVPIEKFIEKAKEVDADIIAASALMTTTMIVQEELAKAIANSGIKTKYLLVGGAVTTKEWAEKIGATYAADAIAAVRVAKRLLGVGE